MNLININLKKVRHKVYALCVLRTENLRMKKPNALAMIGNVVLEPATIVIKHFNYTLTNVKVNLKKYMRNLNRLS